MSETPALADVLLERVQSAYYQGWDACEESIFHDLRHEARTFFPVDDAMHRSLDLFFRKTAEKWSKS